MFDETGSTWRIIDTKYKEDIQGGFKTEFAALEFVLKHLGASDAQFIIRNYGVYNR
jgi:hypothetical protein